MESLANLEAFVRSADLGSFSAAARQLGLTPAAVSRNVAQLEGNLRVRLFQRSTRRLTLTEAGERFLQAVTGGLASVQAAIAAAADDAADPAGRLQVSMAPSFGAAYVLPLLPEFLIRYPAVVPDWRFENRQVDLIGEGYDAAIGGGIALQPGVVARELAPVHIVAVAAPSYIGGKPWPQRPSDLAALRGIVRRSPQSGRVRSWMMRDQAGTEEADALPPHVVLDDPEAMTRAAVMGLGAALVAMPQALPHLESGALVRLVPDWHAVGGTIALYYASRTLLPAKTRAFVDFVVAGFQRQGLARRFSATP